MYLMATYGEGQYVETYHNQQIYLNHKLIENKQLNLAEIQDKSADFLIQFSGVNEAYSAHRALGPLVAPDRTCPEQLSSQTFGRLTDRRIARLDYRGRKCHR